MHTDDRKALASILDSSTGHSIALKYIFRPDKIWNYFEHNIPSFYISISNIFIKFPSEYWEKEISKLLNYDYQLKFAAYILTCSF